MKLLLASLFTGVLSAQSIQLVIEPVPVPPPIERMSGEVRVTCSPQGTLTRFRIPVDNPNVYVVGYGQGPDQGVGMIVIVSRRDATGNSLPAGQVRVEAAVDGVSCLPGGKAHICPTDGQPCTADGP